MTDAEQTAALMTALRKMLHLAGYMDMPHRPATLIHLATEHYDEQMAERANR